MADTASAVTGMLTERKTSQDLASTTQRIQAGQYHHTIELVVFTAGYCVQKKIPTCRIVFLIIIYIYFFLLQKENRIYLYMLYHAYR